MALTIARPSSGMRCEVDLDGGNRGLLPSGTHFAAQDSEGAGLAFGFATEGTEDAEEMRPRIACRIHSIRSVTSANSVANFRCVNAP